MTVFGRMMLIPYFMAYLIHYFYHLKTNCDRKKNFRIGSIVYPKKHLLKKEKNVFLYMYIT